MGLLVTFVLGLFIVIGAIIVFVSKNNKNFINFSISLAFSVIVMLMFVDLIPEIYEIFSENNSLLITIAIMIISAIVGFMILKFLDYYVPDHDGHNHNNLEHIGKLAAIALVLHNIIEGIAIYTVVEESLKSGLLLAVGVGLHNIPLGMIIASSFYKNNKSRKRTSLVIFIVSLSTFVGGLIMLFASGLISETLEGVLLGITLGMLVYISFCELWHKLLEIKNKNIVVSGLILGVLIILITLFI